MNFFFGGGLEYVTNWELFQWELFHVWFPGTLKVAEKKRRGNVQSNNSNSTAKLTTSADTVVPQLGRSFPGPGHAHIELLLICLNQEKTVGVDNLYYLKEQV